MHSDINPHIKKLHLFQHPIINQCISQITNKIILIFPLSVTFCEVFVIQVSILFALYQQLN